MTRKAFPCLFALLLVAGLAPMVPQPLAAQAQAAAPTVDELVEKNIQAKGGREKLKALQSVRMTGKMTMGGQGMEGGIVIETRRPDKMRSDVTIQGMTVSQAYDGKSGWKVVPFTGKMDAEPMTDEELKQARRQASGMDGLMGYKERGETLEYLGKSDLEGTPVHKLKWTRKDGDSSVLYLDAEHFLEIRADSKAMIQGQELESSATLGDYKEVGGLLFPHSMQISMPGGMGGMTMTFDKIEVNPDLPDSRFAMPAKTAPAKPKE
jgi:outer membrane lipoprotein-sorting protein